jgi:hypothetical protein
MESDPKKRPVAQRIIDMLDKTAGDDETGSSSLVELEVRLSLLEERSDRERAGGLRLTDIDGRPDTEDIDEHSLSDYYQQREENADDWSSWEEQNTERKVKRKGKSIFSSSCGVLDKLKNWNIFRKNARKNFARNVGQVPQIRIFTMRELKKITRNYSEMLRQGSFGIVYRGTLHNTMVAVKYFKEHYTSEQFINAVWIQEQMNHKNILNLVGYCLQGDVQISVHEYDANGSLDDILQRNENEMFPLDLRLDIAIGAAEGLRYMHSRRMRHGDVKPSNILFDENFIPKISEFDLSQQIIGDRSDAATVFGTRGYICPVYKETCWLTLKGDVYGFGAVLLELITGKKITYRDYDNKIGCLVTDYNICYINDNTGQALFDEEIAAAENMFVLEEIGKLAMNCLRDDLEELRPSMMEVTNRLVMLRREL